jgi:hypothetical protein
MLVDKGSQVIYVEFEEKERTKRFVVPTGDNIENKIRVFANQSVGIDLIRMGDATVTSRVDSDEAVVGLESIPSTVEAVFNLDMNDHPVLHQGQGRYSSELIKGIMEVQTVQLTLPEVKTEGEIVAPKVESEKPKADLTETLKQQMAQKALEKLSSDKAKKEESAVATPVTPKVEVPAVVESEKPKVPSVNENNMTLSEFLESKKAEKAAAPRPSRPLSKIDKILEKVERIEISLGLEEEMDIDDDELRGQQLRDWFESHVESVGLDRTFEILAGKIKL